LPRFLAGIRSPRRGRKPATWTRIDRDYEALRIGMQTLFDDLGAAEAAGQHDLDLPHPPRNELDRRGGCGLAGSGVVMAAFGSRGRRVPG
jgi:hypothetical protein